GILTEALLRPVGIETLENLIERFRPDTRPLVIDQNFHLAAQPAAGDAHGASRGRERARVVDQVADDLADPGVMPGYLELGQRAALERQRHGDTVGVNFVRGLVPFLRPEAFRRPSATRSADYAIRGPRRLRNSRSPRCACRARSSCRATHRTIRRFHRAGG